MDTLSPLAIRRTVALIGRYGLHRDDALLPVPIRQIARDEGWQVEYRGRMGSAIAMAFVVGPVRLMYVNENLTTQTQRVGIAHEMAHVLAGHKVSADAWMTTGHEEQGWTKADEEQEREAKLLAAVLLVPWWIRDSPLSDQDVADLCDVTLGVVKRYRQARPLDEPYAMELTG